MPGNGNGNQRCDPLGSTTGYLPLMGYGRDTRRACRAHELLLFAAARLSKFNQRLWGCHLGCAST
jgi:hypothetical protein